MIKVFTTNEDAIKAGDLFNRLYTEWYDDLDNAIEIITISSNSNKNGWMMIIHYKEISEC
jgi:hypothetical protein